MNVAASLRKIYSSPLGSFLPLPNPRGYLDDPSLAHCDDGPPVADLGPVTECGWRLEGSTRFGTQLHAVPVSLLGRLPPLQVDIIIPDQTLWSPDLWAKLDASRSAHMTDGRFNQLGIAKHVLRVLGHWSMSLPDFEEQYLALPLSSSIIISEITSNIERTQVRFAPAKHHSHMLTPAALQRLWDPIGLKLPHAIDLNEMQYLERKASRVALVQIKHFQGDGPFILKAGNGNPDALYHEIKQLLSLPSHPNLIAHPLFITTIKEPGTNIRKVCGFVLRFYTGPNFEIGLKQKRWEGTLVLADQLRWAKDITKALICINESSIRYASDLKMDNIMMAMVDGQETPILIEFEQGRNTFSWAPTEIYLIEWLAIVSNASCGESSVRNGYTRLLKEYCASREVDFTSFGHSNTYDNPSTGWYLPWVVSTKAEQEAGNVCLLGKVIWCIFEGVGNINVALRSSRPNNETPEFPTFIRTPLVIQELVKSCTQGSREWTEGPLGLTRTGSKIHPRGKSGKGEEEVASLDETRVAVQKVWSDELKKGEALIQARMRHDKGIATTEDIKRLEYTKRPLLAQVLAKLETISLN